MKPNTHPSSYRKVVFKDMSCDHRFIVHSCVNTKETTVWEDGNEYPLYKLEISSMSVSYTHLTLPTILRV